MRLRTLQNDHGTVTTWENHLFPATSAFVVELPAGSLTTRAVRRHAAAVRLLARGL